MVSIDWALTLENFLLFSKSLIWFLGLIIIGGVVSKFIKGLTHKVLTERLKLDEVMKKHKLDDSLGNSSISSIIASILMWLVFLIFLTEASTRLYLGNVSNLLVEVVRYIPQIIFAIIIGIIGLITADWITDRIRDTKGKTNEIIAMILKPFIIFFSLILAGEQLGFELGFLVDTLKWSIIGLAWGISLALALSIGLGYGLDNKKVPELVEKSLKKMSK